MPANRLSTLREKALLVAERLQLDPDEHHVYFHSLSIVPNAHTFLSGTTLAERVDSVAIGFWVNPKQEKNQKIRLMNHLFRDVLEPDHQFANYLGVQYTLTGRELESIGTFSNEIVTFIHRSLPVRHRKLKVALWARPAHELNLHSSDGVSTRMDLRYERFTPIELPRRTRFIAPPTASPRFIWRGTSRAEELHSFLQPEREYLDVGELTRMIERSRSVCRVEMPRGIVYGTGVLIAPNLVLTNYHVLERGKIDQTNIFDSAHDVVLRFGVLADGNGNELPGETMQLHPESPIAASSRTKELDFVLLRLARPVSDLFTPTPFALAEMKPHDTLHILQHPVLQEANNPMKLTMRPNAVTGVYPDRGRVQYVTYATRGASGAPCFNREWNMVAIHRAEQAVGFGTRREGVLFSSIYKQIATHLERDNA